MGGWAEGVRQRHVERRRLRHQLALRRHHRPPARCLLQGLEFNPQSEPLKKPFLLNEL